MVRDEKAFVQMTDILGGGEDLWIADARKTERIDLFHFLSVAENFQPAHVINVAKALFSNSEKQNVPVV